MYQKKLRSEERNKIWKTTTEKQEEEQEKCRHKEYNFL